MNDNDDNYDDCADEMMMTMMICYWFLFRETRRERILENRRKTLKVKEKQLKMTGS